MHGESRRKLTAGAAASLHHAAAVHERAGGPQVAGIDGREMSGAEMVIHAVEAEGTQYVFGYPGGAIMPVYDALLDAPRLKHIMARHEQGATHMADGYARASGDVGVCFATSGPGATNLITGIATAFMDSSPLVAITGQVASHLIGTDAFQEADVFGLSLPVTKHSYLVRRTEDIPRIIKEAFHVARTGRPGPVMVDIPKDLQLARAPFRWPRELELPGYHPAGEADPREIETIVDALQRSRRPLLYVGGGAISSGASDALRRFALRTGIPVTMTLMGLGAFPAGHEQSLGMLGMHGAVYANRAVSQCDLLIAAGARFDDRVTGRVDRFAAGATIVHIDADAAEHSKIVHADHLAHGDLRLVLEQVLEHLEDRKVQLDFSPWLEAVTAWKRRYPLPLHGKTENSGCLCPSYVIEQLARRAGKDAIVVTDVGQHQMWTAQYYPIVQPRSWITSGGLGTMGFGLPAAIGAKIRYPDRPVICISGDGSIQMNIQELTTAVSNRLGIVVAILDNQALGMVRQWQALFHDQRFSCVDLPDNPDFVKIARAFGGTGEDISDPRCVPAAIEKALTLDVPSFLRFRTHNDENVYPIVPAGRSVDEAITGD